MAVKSYSTIAVLLLFFTSAAAAQKVGVKISDDIELTLGSDISSIESALWFIGKGTTNQGIRRKEDQKEFIFSKTSNPNGTSSTGFASLFEGGKNGMRNNGEKERFEYATDKDGNIYYIFSEKSLFEKINEKTNFLNSARNPNNTLDITFASRDVVSKIGRQYLIFQNRFGTGVNEKYIAIFSNPSTCIPKSFFNSWKFSGGKTMGWYSVNASTFLDSASYSYDRWVSGRVSYDNSSSDPIGNTNCKWVSEVRMNASGYVSYVGIHGDIYRNNGLRFQREFNNTPLEIRRKQISPF